MQQPQGLFSEDDVSKPKLAAEQPLRQFNNFFVLPGVEEETAPAAFAGRADGGSVKYFDLIAQGSFFNAAGAAGEADRMKEPVFAKAGKNKTSFFITARNFSSNSKSFPAAAGNSEKLTELLLFYFDQIVYLKEMSERIRELSAAVEDENIARVNLLARDCVSLSNHCGMLSAIAPLQCLAQIKTRLQMRDAEFLIRRIKKEFSRFRDALKESLEQLAKHVRLNDRTARR